jgi:hypothetical protein
MPKAPVPAQIIIALLAVLVIIYSASVVRLSEDSSGTRHAAPGQLVVVVMHSSWTSLQSSNASVLAPISVSLKPITRGYFLALKPGKATLRAFGVACSGCLSASRTWRAEIEVWPG